jgi:hypothetical protein
MTNQSPDQTMKPSTVAKAWQSSFAPVPAWKHEALKNHLAYLDAVDNAVDAAKPLTAPVCLMAVEDVERAMLLTPARMADMLKARS